MRVDSSRSCKRGEHDSHIALSLHFSFVLFLCSLFIPPRSAVLVSCFYWVCGRVVGPACREEGPLGSHSPRSAVFLTGVTLSENQFGEGRGGRGEGRGRYQRQVFVYK